MMTNRHKKARLVQIKLHQPHFFCGCSRYVNARDLDLQASWEQQQMAALRHTVIVPGFKDGAAMMQQIQDQ